MSEYPAQRPKRPPTHPGALLRDDVLPDLNITKTDFALRLRISRQTLYAILAEREPVSVNTALKLGRLLGNGPNLWVNMQKEYDLWRAAETMKEDLSKIEPLAT